MSREFKTSLALCLLAVSMAGLLFVHRLWSSGDNLDYLLFARSLQHGEWGAILGWRFPPGYPLLLSVVFALCGCVLPLGLFTVPEEAFLAAKLFGLVCFPLAVIAVYRVCRRTQDSAAPAVMVAALFAVNQDAAVYATFISTEIPYTVLSMAALIFWLRAAEEAPARLRAAVGASVLTLAAISLRGVGISLAVAAALPVLWASRDSKRLARGVLALMPLVIYLLFSYWAAGNQAHMQQVVESEPLRDGIAMPLVPRIIGNATRYSRATAGMLVPKVLGEQGLLSLVHLQSVTPVYIIAMLALVVAGFVRAAIRQRCGVAEWYVVGYLGILLLWPHHDSRFLLPVLPLILGYFLNGLHAFIGFLKRRRPFQRVREDVCLRMVFLALLSWGIFTNAFAGAKNWRHIRALADRPPWAPERYEVARENEFAEQMRMAEWIGENMPPGVPIFCNKALFVELVAHRPALYFPVGHEPEETWRLMRERAQGPEWCILMDVFSPASSYGRRRVRFLDPVIERYAGQVELVQEGRGGARLYRVRSGLIE